MIKKLFMFLVIVFLVSCDNTSKDGEVAVYPKGNLDFVAPAGAGGGWDLTIRTIAKILKDTDLVKVPMPIRNVPGAGGAIHLGGLQSKKGSDKIITVYSPPIILINLNGTTEYSFRDTTPLAMLLKDYGAFAVRKDSPYTNIMDVMNALKEDPKSVKIGGVSSAGSMDHIQFLIMAKAAGVPNIEKIDYVAFDGDGATQVLGGHIDLYSAGLTEVEALLESGDLRVLAQTADKRIGKGAKAEVPTCIESGIDKTFVNWRGVFGPPDMPEYAVTFWTDTFQKMSESNEWLDICETYGWDASYMNQEDFTRFLENTEQEYEVVLEDIGMLKN